MRLAAAVALLLSTLGAASADAHPHAWIDYTVTVRFGAEGPEGVRVDWAFDEMLSELIIQKYDADRDGKFSAGETRALEHDHFSRLKDFNWFVEVKLDGTVLPVKEPKDFEARNVKGQLHYLFTVPIPRATRREGTVDVNVIDTTFYTALTAIGAMIAAESPPGYRVECAPVREPKTKLVETLRCTYRRQGR
jgi:ABC-type uncharacterized transport system substrate-binding protein